MTQPRQEDPSSSRPDAPASAPTVGTGPPASRPLDGPTRMMPPKEEPRPEGGTPFGRYRLLEKLGQGGMGVVWKALDTQLERVVALKQILRGQADLDAAERFLREAQAAAKLKHPNIVGVYDVGVIDGSHYFTADYVEGPSLDRAVREKPLPVKQAVALVKTVAEALSYAHDQGIVHRDIKPQNILLDARGTPFLVDFGLAKDVQKQTEEPLTLTGQILGTPDYMSPEQADGQTAHLGPESDQFSLGAVLYELITGTRPFTASSVVGVLARVLTADPTRPTQVSREVHRDVETICLKALEKDPARRYASMADFAADLGRYLDGLPIHARPVSTTERLWRAVHRRKGIVATVSLAAIVGLGSLGWTIYSSRRSEADVADARTTAEAEELRRRHAEAGKRAREEALQMCEAARPALEQARQYACRPDATYDELVRRVDLAQKPLDEAIKRAPDLALGHYLLGIAKSLKGLDAQDHWTKALHAEAFGPAWVQSERQRLTRALLARLHTSKEEAEADRPWVEYIECERWRPSQLAWKTRPAMADLTPRPAGDHGDPVQRRLVEALEALVRDDVEAFRELAAGAIEEFPDAQGIEDFHWLSGYAATGAERMRRYDEALSIRPKHAEVLFCRGVERHNQGDIEGAIADYTEAAEFKPRFSRAVFQRGLARIRKGDTARGNADLDAAVRMDTRLVVVLDKCGFPVGKYGKLKPPFIDDLQMLVHSGRVRHQKGEWDKSLSDFAQALALLEGEVWPEEEKKAGVLLHRGAALRAKGDVEGALADFSASLEILERELPAGAYDPRLVDGYHFRGSLRKEKGDVAGADADFTLVADLYVEGGTKMERGANPTVAAAWYATALEVAPPDWPDRKRVKQALEALEARTRK